MKQVTLLTKPGCHLCDAVEQVILSVLSSHGFNFIQRNILNDPDDFRRYGTEIPVVFVDGVEIARHRLTHAQLLAAIES